MATQIYPPRRTLNASTRRVPVAPRIDTGYAARDRAALQDAWRVAGQAYGERCGSERAVLVEQVYHKIVQTRGAISL
jgi:hypothetical protein